MSNYTPTTEIVRGWYAGARYVFGDPDRQHPDMEDEFDRWLAAHDAEVRAEALRGAADSVHAEARWQQEQVMRGAVMKSGVKSAVERLLVVEQLIRNQASYYAQEGNEP